MGNAMSQMWVRHEPAITEKNTPDQLGRVHFITGGYGGCGLDLAKLLYKANATVYIAGRSQEKADKAIEEIRGSSSDSKGKVSFVKLDLSDLKTIKPAIQQFLSTESKVHVLTLNAGVMTPPKGSKDAQGEDLQIGTNCLGSYLVYKLLRPTLLSTAADAPRGSVRCTWAASLVVELSPRGGGMKVDEAGRPTDQGVQGNYAQSKVGNVFLANEAAKRDADSSVVHVAWNPGNLKSGLQRHKSSVEGFMIDRIVYPSIYGGYTELFAALGQGLEPKKEVQYVVPWGRVGDFRADVKRALSDEGSTKALSSRFVGWVEQRTSEFT